MELHRFFPYRLARLAETVSQATAQVYRERYSLVRFGTGFMRLALEHRTPIVPFAFLGGGEAIPTVLNLDGLGRMVGVPYVPVTPYVLPVPRPVHVELHFGAPMHFEGTGTEDDTVIDRQVAAVQERIADLIARGRQSYDPGRRT